MSSLVQITEADEQTALLAVVEHYLVGEGGDRSKFEEHSAQLQSKGGAEGLAYALSFLCEMWGSRKAGTLPGAVTDEEVVASFTLVVSLASAVQVLSGLFNALPAASAARCPVFLAVVQVAQDTDSYAALSGYFANLPAWLAEWGAEAPERAAIYGAAADLAEANGDADGAYGLLLRYLNEFQGGAAGDPASASAKAVAACRAAVNDPIAKFKIVDDKVEAGVSLVQLDAVKALKGAGGAGGKTHELMTIFLEGKQQDLVAFMKGNDAAALGVDADACERNIRMLTLCTLCAAESELGYAQIAEGLGVALEDVEEWIVLAINEGLVTAKLDQLRELVLVQKSAQRVFNETQWKSLSEQLHSWRNNVGQLMEQVEKARGSTVELLKNERLA